jgi:hypothetical protein
MQFDRKKYPLFTGLVKYFPDALLEVSRCSWAGNQQHHPDKPLHWDRGKSNDHLDAMLRHTIQSGQIDGDGVRHSAKARKEDLFLMAKLSPTMESLFMTMTDT